MIRFENPHKILLKLGYFQIIWIKKYLNIIIFILTEFNVLNGIYRPIKNLIIHLLNYLIYRKILTIKI